MFHGLLFPPTKFHLIHLKEYLLRDTIRFHNTNNSLSHISPIQFTFPKPIPYQNFSWINKSFDHWICLNAKCLANSINYHNTIYSFHIFLFIFISLWASRFAALPRHITNISLPFHPGPTRWLVYPFGGFVYPSRRVLHMPPISHSVISHRLVGIFSCNMCMFSIYFMFPQTRFSNFSCLSCFSHDFPPFSPPHSLLPPPVCDAPSKEQSERWEGGEEMPFGKQKQWRSQMGLFKLVMKKKRGETGRLLTRADCENMKFSSTRGAAFGGKCYVCWNQLFDDLTQC